MAPLTRAQIDEPTEVEKDLLRSELDKVVELVNITETKSIEVEKKSVPPVKEHKPYIVKATPKDVVQPVVEILNDTLEKLPLGVDNKTNYKIAVSCTNRKVKSGN